jgi:DNA polymerase-3 subunit delta'
MKVGYNDRMSWNIIGHDWAVQLLMTHIASHQVRHAYLFTGPDSIGKRTLAVRFAQALNCRNAAQAGLVCGECRACRLIQEGTFPDAHIIEAQEGATVIKVEQIRDLQRELALTPYEAKWRIAILLQFHEAHESAANALLKTLEEPSPHVVILLTARSAESLLPTIVSRCELFNLRAPTRDELERVLVERGESKEKARLLAGISSGRPGYALRLLANPALLDQRTKILNDFVGLLGNNRAMRFAYVEEVTRGKDLQVLREHAEDVLVSWGSLWRDVLVTSTDADTATQNPDRAEDIERLASKLDTDQVFHALQKTMESIDAIHRFGNIRMVLETLMLDLPTLSL